MPDLAVLIEPLLVVRRVLRELSARRTPWLGLAAGRPGRARSQKECNLSSTERLLKTEKKTVILEALGNGKFSYRPRG